MTEKIEYRVRPVTRFVVTRYHDSGPDVTARSEQKGEYANADTAFEVANALCLEEQRQFEPESAPEFVFPKRVDQGAQIGGGLSSPSWSDYAEGFHDAHNRAMASDPRRAGQPFTAVGVQSLNNDVTGQVRELEDQAISPVTQRLEEFRELHEPAYIKISFCPAGLNPRGYMQASSSFPADITNGETWRRGNDLPDGPFTAETFQRILERTKQVLREHGMEG